MPNPLQAPLDACARYGAEYAGTLANHLPMLLHALHELGAPPARLAQFAAGYSRRLQPASAGSATLLEPASHLGQWEAFPDLLAHFSARVRAQGRDACVREALPLLMPGVSAAAFHGLLRTAHGLAAGHDGEVAQGLAYWVARHQPLCLTANLPQPDLSLAPWWAQLSTWAQDETADGRLISGRMRAWANKPGFAAMALRLQPDETVLPGLARQAATLYAHSGDFTLLHVVTSSWAMHVLTPLQQDGDAALRHYAAAVAAGWLASGRGQPGAPAPLPLLAWPTIIEGALASEDDHIAKLVFAARSWYRLTGHEEFQQAAACAAAGNLRG